MKNFQSNFNVFLKSCNKYKFKKGLVCSDIVRSKMSEFAFLCNYNFLKKNNP